MHPDGQGGTERFHPSKAARRALQTQRTGGYFSIHLMKLRSNFSDALKNSRRLYVSLENGDLHRLFLAISKNDTRGLLHPAHLEGSGMTTGGVHEIHQSQAHLSLLKIGIWNGATC